MTEGAPGEWAAARAGEAPAPVVRCALHPEAPSRFTCTRCGRFTCEACQGSADAQLCAGCAPLVLDPLGFRQLPFEPVALLGAGLRLAWSELSRLVIDGALAGVLLAAYHALHREAGLALPPMAWRPGLVPRRLPPP